MTSVRHKHDARLAKSYHYRHVFHILAYFLTSPNLLSFTFRNLSPRSYVTKIKLKTEKYCPITDLYKYSMHCEYSLFAPGPIRSQERIGQQDPVQFAPWPFRSVASLLPGPLTPWSEMDRELSFPGTFAPRNFSSLLCPMFMTLIYHIRVDCTPCYAYSLMIYCCCGINVF